MNTKKINPRMIGPGSKIEKWVKEVIGREGGFLVHPKDLKNGDYTLIVAEKTAESDFRLLDKNKIKEIDKIELIRPRFINIYLAKCFFTESVKEIIEQGDQYGKTDLLKEQKIIVEHTQPNPFKEFHIGHLMNNAIGESISRIIESNGANVRVCSYHGDVGLHVAKAIWGKIKNPSQSWGESYAFGAQNFEENKDQIIEINKKIYDKSDESINLLYAEGRKESLAFFDSLYKKLDSNFSEHFYESFAGEEGKKIVKDNIGRVFEKSDEAIVFRGENFEPKTHTRVFLNSEGLPTYEAKEVGLAKLKIEKFGNYDRSITITANEQDSFFAVVEVAIGEIFPNLKNKIHHLSHGMLRLSTGKMSSRTGNVITAVELIEQVKEKVKAKIADRGFDDAEKESISEIVAIGAIKYSILRQAIGGDIIFDFDKSISFEGDSGPYLQYTAVRANSVLAKAPKSNLWQKFFGQKISLPQNWQITEIERLLYRFPEIVERAAKEYAPHHLVTYLTELASSFNSFYANEKIINDKNSEYKIALTKAVYTTLKNGLELLGMKVPFKM